MPSYGIQAHNGEITKEEYDNWRYNYPRDDKTQIWTHVPSAGLMESIVADMKKKHSDRPPLQTNRYMKWAIRFSENQMALLLLFRGFQSVLSDVAKSLPNVLFQS